jgi:anti-sigma factor RsiW
MLSCDDVFDLLSDGEVPADKKKEVDEHLVRCARCRREEAALDDFEDALRHPEDHEATPPAVREAILAQVKARRRRGFPPFALLLLVALALVIGGAVVLHRSEPAPPVTREPSGVELGDLDLLLSEARKAHENGKDALARGDLEKVLGSSKATEAQKKEARELLAKLKD